MVVPSTPRKRVVSFLALSLLLQVAKSHFGGGGARIVSHSWTLYFRDLVLLQIDSVMGGSMAWVFPHPTDGSCSLVVVLIWLNPSLYQLVYCDIFPSPLTSFFFFPFKKYFICLFGAGSQLQHAHLSLQCMGSRVVLCELLSWPGIEPNFPALEGRFLTTGPLGKPLSHFFNQGKITHTCKK